jgi:hypothetical protein
MKFPYNYLLVLVSVNIEKKVERGVGYEVSLK